MAENQTEAPPPIQPPPPPTTSAPPPPDPESRARTWNMLCHLSILAGYIIPFGNFLGPFLIWQIMKNEVPSVETHAKDALNFQFTVLIVLIAGFVIAFILSFFCIGYLLFPVLGVIALCDIILPIIAGVKANNGVAFKYPYTIQFLK
ncbi:MAG: DUF4870 domain-containing protein [Verrucomicrobiota bacterium]